MPDPTSLSDMYEKIRNMTVISMATELEHLEETDAECISGISTDTLRAALYSEIEKRNLQAAIARIQGE